MKRIILPALLMLSCAIVVADTPPSTQPAPVIRATPSTQPVAVPFRLTDTNHILVRLKINGQGPYNFIVDTGAPAMFLRVPVAKKIGLKPNDRNIASIDTLEIEGGLTLNNMQCLVETPYQIEGMNAVGASGVELDGLLGYSVLARFRMQIDLSKDRMWWTLLDYVPPRLRIPRSSIRGNDAQEQKLESTGSILKILGPLIKPTVLAAKHHGAIGVEMIDLNQTVMIHRVLGGSPAEKAGIKSGDQLLMIGKKKVQSVIEAQAATADVTAGKSIELVIQRNHVEIKLTIISGEEL